MRGTTVQPPDDEPTPSGQGGIGSDAVADERAPEDVPDAHAKGGRVGYAKGGGVGRKPAWRKHGW